MSIQTGAGPIRVDADDLQITYRGVTLAVKVRIVSWAQIIGCIKQSDGSWQSKVDLTGDLFSSDPWTLDYAVEHYGSARAFVAEIVMPRLNAWLAVLFTPGQVSPADQVAAALSGIKLTPQPDGTLLATLP